MNDYWLTFLLSGEGADSRRDELLRALRERSDRWSWWDETGTFVLFQSDLSIEELRMAAEDVLDDTDFALIGMVYILRWEMIGKPRNEAFFSTMRYLPGI